MPTSHSSSEWSSVLKGYSPCGDNEAAIDVARALGAEAKVEGSELTIRGGSTQGPDGNAPGRPFTRLGREAQGARGPLPSGPMSSIHVGESGLLTRLMIPLTAAIQGKDITGIITAQRAPLRPFDTDLGNCPDLFPIVSVLAAFCGGRSNIQGFKRLAGKESDRGKAILEMLTKMGVPAFAEGDTMTVDGMTLERRLLTGNLLKGGEYSSSHDHRMAMALTVASLGADGPITIDDTACVAKSFPHFFDIWNQAF